MPDYEQVMELEGGVDFKVMAVPYSWAEMAEWGRKADTVWAVCGQHDWNSEGGASEYLAFA